MCAVEWKKLGDVIQVLRGRRLTKTELLEEGQYKVFHGGLEPLGYYNLNNREADSVMVINVGASAGTVGYCDSDFWSSDGCFTLSKNPLFLPKYIYCYLKQEECKISSKVRKAGIPTLDAKVIEDIYIPLIPITKQQEIVSHLDTFTTLISNLESELDMRRKQYEHYRNQLLDFEGVEGVEWKTLGKICEIKGRIGFRGYTRDDQVEKGEGAIALTATNIVNQKINYDNCTYISWFKYEESPEIKVNIGDIILCQRGSIGKVAIVKELPERATINPQLLLLKNISCYNYFLIYYLCSAYFQKQLFGIIGHGTIQMISQRDLSSLCIPIPPLNTQQEIVSKLDVFEKLIQSLEQEIKLRKQQYEYYREKLLTFEKE